MSPTGLSARAVNSKKVSLTWHRPAAHVAVASYVVYRDGAKVGTSKKLSFSDVKVKAGVTYSYRIGARTKSGKVSAPSVVAIVTTHATTTTGGGTPKPVPPPAGFPRAANTGYEHAPGYPGHLKNCSNVPDSQQHDVQVLRLHRGVAIGSARSHPVNVTFVGCRFASNAVVNADVADYGSHVVFSYDTFEPSTVAAGPGPSSPYAAPIDTEPRLPVRNRPALRGLADGRPRNFWGFAQAIEFGHSSQAQPVVVSNSWIHNPRAPGGIGLDHTDGILENYGGVSYMVFHHNSIVGNGNTNALALQGSSPTGTSPLRATTSPATATWSTPGEHAEPRAWSSPAMSGALISARVGTAVRRRHVHHSRPWRPVGAQHDQGPLRDQVDVHAEQRPVLVADRRRPIQFTSGDRAQAGLARRLTGRGQAQPMAGPRRRLSAVRARRDRRRTPAPGRSARRPARPTGRARAAGGGSLSTLSAAATIRSGSRPTSWFVPSVTVIGRSVLSRRVRHGTPSTVVSSCTPPESVSTSRADACSATKSR